MEEPLYDQILPSNACPCNMVSFMQNLWLCRHRVKHIHLRQPYGSLGAPLFPYERIWQFVHTLLRNPNRHNVITKFVRITNEIPTVIT